MQEKKQSLPTLTGLDRLIGYISPARALRRKMARDATEIYGQVRENFMATYRGALETRTSTPWNRDQSTRGGTPQVRYSLGNMRNRARKVYKNNVIGRSLLNTETDNIVADGLTLQVQSSSPEFNKEAESRWYDWLEIADVRGMHSGLDLQRLSWTSPRLDGDGGFVLVSENGRSRLQYIPGDLIGAGTSGWKENICDGVEVNAAGRPVAFHICQYDENGNENPTVVDANDFVYLTHLQDPLDLRGGSVFTPIFPLLDQIDGYVDAVVIASRMAAIFGLIFKSANPSKEMALLENLTTAGGESQKALTMENGMLKYLGTKDDVVQVQAQQPMQQVPDFIRAILRLICLQFDMPLEIGQKDLSQVNFSGGRIGLIGYYRSCRAKQIWLISRCWSRIFRWWASREVKMGGGIGRNDRFANAVPSDFLQHEFHGREWDYNDPLAEAKADLMEIAAGLNSPQKAAANRGRDFVAIQRDNAEARKLRSNLGLPELPLPSETREVSSGNKQKITVDEKGNLVAQPETAAAAPLNGAQITAAIDVLAKVREGALSDQAAGELLAQVGIERSKAQAIVSSLAKMTSGTGDVAFKREVLKALLSVPAARESVYNATDIEDLITQTGLSPEKNYQAPYIPVVAATGPLVDGEVIKDSQGDIVGGDVEEPEPSTPTGSPETPGTPGKSDQGQQAAEQQDTAPSEDSSQSQE